MKKLLLILLVTALLVGLCRGANVAQGSTGRSMNGFSRQIV